MPTSTHDSKRMRFPLWDSMAELAIKRTIAPPGRVPDAILDAIPDMINWGRKSITEIAFFLGVPKQDILKELKDRGIKLRPKTVLEAIRLKKT